MKALVAGATGFVGAHLVRALLARNHQVIALARPGSAHLWRLEEVRGDLRVVPWEALAGGLDDVDVCFNLASYGVNYAEADPGDLVEGNLTVALRLVTFCRDHGIGRMIQVGSGFEYENTGRPISEADRILPASLYGSAKAAASHMALALARKAGVNLTLLRPFSVYGPMEGGHRLIPQIMKALITGEPLPLTPGGQIRDYLFVEDLASALVLAAEAGLPPGSVFNICGDRDRAMADLVREICGILQGDYGLFRFGSLPYRVDEMMCYVGDDARIRSALDWSPRWDLAGGIRKTHAFYAAVLGGR